ncbi:MAG: glycosyltransferase family 4 protein [Candidatus Sumerlaeia bacterium]
MPSRPVLFLSPSSKLFGARRSLLTTVTNLPAPWVPIVVCPPGRGGLQAELAARDISHKIIKHYNWRKGRFLLHRYLEVRALRRLATQVRPALIVANEFWSTPYALRAVVESGTPVIAYSRLSITPRQIRNYELGRADLIVCVSRAAAEDFRGESWFEDKVRVLHNAVDVAALELPEPERTDARRAFRAELGLSDGDFLIGLVGVISERKRPETALRALRMLHERGMKAHLVLAGKPRPGEQSYESRLQKLAAGWDLGRFVHFVGFRQDISRLYPALDVNLLLSDEEGFGRVVIEAGLFGIPTIGTRVGGIPEIIRDGQTGALIGLDDAAALADILRGWAADAALRRRLGEAAARQAREEFSISRHISRLVALFDEALDKYEHCW